MNTTAIGIDARGYLSGWLQAVTGMMVADINAIPDDQWSKNQGGCTRPAGALLADTITNLIWTTETMNGEESSAYNNMESLAVECADKSVAISKLNEATAAFAASLAAASEERLNSVVMAPWQMPTPMFMLATIAVNHIWYHDGQLNYLQCMLGDEKVHWMGD